MDRFHLHNFATLDSTQTEAKKPTYSAGDVIMADVQTNGYGRRSRAWQAPPGNLTFTFLEKYDNPEKLSWIGYAISLGLYDAVQLLLKDNARLNVKWPNDILINGRKLSGMIIEVENDNLVIGIGVNIANIPQTDQPTTSLNSYAIKPQSPREILDRFLSCYQHWFTIGQSEGFEAMRDIWLARAAFVGETITAKLADGNILTGVFKDIDKNGALVLLTENGQYNVTSADIYLTKEKE